MPHLLAILTFAIITAPQSYAAEANAPADRTKRGEEEEGCTASVKLCWLLLVCLGSCAAMQTTLAV